MDLPETRYARAPDGISIAYQVIGDGPVDLLWIPGYQGNLEVMWEQPLVATFFAKLAAFSRVIVHDRRATGLSDRATSLPDLETRVDDTWTVLDAAGSRSTVVFGSGEGAHTAAVFAATHPNRTRALVLYGVSGRISRAPDYEWGASEQERAHELQMVRDAWGTEAYASIVVAEEAPSKVDDRDFIRWFAKMMRHWVSPSSAAELVRIYYDTDIRAVLPSIDTPTLVLAGAWGEGREAEDVSDSIKDAEFQKLPGRDAITFLDAGDLIEAIRDFIGVEARPAEHDTMLRSLLFFDIVGSTEHASRVGDKAWRDDLERFRSLVRERIRRLGGTEVDTAGDGFFAAFEGPAASVRCAHEIVDGVRALGFEVRAGVHTGQVESIEGKIGGIAAHVAARICALAGASEILVSRTVKDLVAGSGLRFEDAGEHELKGVPDRWQLYRWTP
jgi:class 3 adenylate cyclase